MARRRDLGSLSPRLLALSAKTNPVEPYPITDNLAIRQTRQRRDDLNNAYADIVSSTQKLNELQRRASALPKPELAKDATEEQAEAFAGELVAWQAQIDIMQSSADELSDKANAAGERYNRAFFGEAYEAIMELSADWDPDFFDAFKADVNDHFSQGVNAPPDGRDDDGKIVDVVEAVEAGKSPT